MALEEAASPSGSPDCRSRSPLAHSARQVRRRHHATPTRRPGVRPPQSAHPGRSPQRRRCSQTVPASGQYLSHRGECVSRVFLERLEQALQGLSNLPDLFLGLAPTAGGGARLKARMSLFGRSVAYEDARLRHYWCPEGDQGCARTDCCSQARLFTLEHGLSLGLMEERLSREGHQILAAVRDS